MASPSPPAPTNERIVQMLAEVQRQLAVAEQRARQMAADVERLLADR
jgi:hypothetical protein